MIIGAVLQENEKSEERENFLKYHGISVNDWVNRMQADNEWGRGLLMFANVYVIFLLDA